MRTYAKRTEERLAWRASHGISSKTSPSMWSSVVIIAAWFLPPKAITGSTCYRGTGTLWKAVPVHDPRYWELSADPACGIANLRHDTSLQLIRVWPYFLVCLSASGASAAGDCGLCAANPIRANCIPCAVSSVDVLSCFSQNCSQNMENCKDECNVND